MRRWHKNLIVVLFILGVWIFLAPFLATIFVVHKPIESAEAAWVLGGSSAYRERTHAAAEAHRRGVVSKIFVVNDGVFSGWNESEQRNLPIYELSKRELISHGVPVEAIEILPNQVEGTNYEADLFAEVVRQRKLKSVLLVTSAYHSRRTLWTFNQAMLKNNLSVEIGLQSPPPGEQTPSPWAWWLTPNGWRMVGGEYLKTPYYWLFY